MIEDTNSIIDPNTDRNRKIKYLVQDYERYHQAARKRSYKNVFAATVECSQCHRKMSKKIADLQLENKRENAPICIPCITGVPRKNLMEKISDENKKRSSEGVKKFFEQRKKKYKQ